MSRTWTFHGGIHPPENKRQSLRGAIRPAPLPEILTLPLSQHIGAPAKPVVAVGDKVLKGQVIAEADGVVSAAVHASSSGTVTAIAESSVPHPSGQQAPCIVIATDGEERWLDRPPPADYRTLHPSALLASIRNAGITGLGGAGFPTAVKLQPRQPIDTLIINATECEPYITADDALIREHAADIIYGIDILARVLDQPREVLIGIEDNKPEARDALRKALTSRSPSQNNISVVEFPTKYPSGGEKQLIQILTGREVPAGKLPADLGMVCQNIGTTYAIFRAVCHGEPLISRVTTVTGNACGVPGNYQVLLGTPVADLLRAAQFNEDQCQRLIMGGPMMGYTLSDLSVPVVKATNCLLAADSAETPANNFAQACIRCGHCAEVCPVNLLPQQLYWYAKSQDYERLTAHNLADCIECGACSYVCPSDIPLVQYYRAAKGEIRLQAREKIVADHARQRFEYHQQRVARAEAEKAAKRAARRQAATARGARADTTSSVVQAALARVQTSKKTPQQERERLDRAVVAAENRVTRAAAKRAACDPDAPQYAQLSATLQQSELRLAEARANRQSYRSDRVENPSANSTAINDNRSQVPPVAEPTLLETDSVASNRAAQAIARAQRKASEQAELSPADKLKNQCDKLNARLQKARDRLDQATANEDAQVEAFVAAVTALEAKLSKAEAQLREALGQHGEQHL